jgi:hypothetical protein
MKPLIQLMRIVTGIALSLLLIISGVKQNMNEGTIVGSILLGMMMSHIIHRYSIPKNSPHNIRTLIRRYLEQRKNHSF